MLCSLPYLLWVTCLYPWSYNLGVLWCRCLNLSFYKGRGYGEQWEGGEPWGITSWRPIQTGTNSGCLGVLQTLVMWPHVEQEGCDVLLHRVSSLSYVILILLEDTGMSANVLCFGSQVVNVGVWHCFFQVFYSLQSSTIFRVFWLCNLDRCSLAYWSNPKISVWGKCFKTASNSVGIWGELRPFCFLGGFSISCQLD